MTKITFTQAKDILTGSNWEDKRELQLGRSKAIASAATKHVSVQKDSKPQ